MTIEDSEEEQSKPSLLSAEHQDKTEDAHRQHRLISKVLAPAVKLWLRSQLEQVEALQVEVEAGDRQLLSGAIEQVNVTAARAVYRGLHLTQAEVRGENLRTNLSQMLRGKPFRLLAEFPVAVRMCLSEADLNASLKSPLLANAVIDFLLLLLAEDEGELAGQSVQDLTLSDPQATLSPGEITLNATLLSATGAAIPVVVRTGLSIEGHLLKLDRPQWLPHANAQRGLLLKELHGFCFDLGQVSLTELSITAAQIVCQGCLVVSPAT